MHKSPLSPISGYRVNKRVSPRVITVFFIALFICLSLIGLAIHRKNRLETFKMENLILERRGKIGDIITALLFKTQALAALVIQDNGQVEDFDRVAATIIDDPAILNILLAPNGVVTKVYPHSGNERLVGFDLLGQGEGNKEAVKAKELGTLVIGGPFTLMQGGGEALVGRLPIFMDLPGGGKRFWGLVSVTLRFPQVLAGAGLELLEHEGYTYEIWRVNPDDGQRQIITGSRRAPGEGAPYFEEHIPILNADW